MDAAGLQEWHDRYYQQHGPCCSGCDWWRSYNIKAGECRKNAPVDGTTRWAMIGIGGISGRKLNAGHVVTRHDHLCGDFKDDFDWSASADWLSQAHRPIPIDGLTRRPRPPRFRQHQRPAGHAIVDNQPDDDFAADIEQHHLVSTLSGNIDQIDQSPASRVNLGNDGIERRCALCGPDTGLQPRESQQRRNDDGDESDET